MSRISQMVHLLNSEAMPTSQDFAYYYTDLDKSLNDYANFVNTESNSVKKRQNLGLTIFLINPWTQPTN